MVIYPSSSATFSLLLRARPPLSPMWNPQTHILPFSIGIFLHFFFLSHPCSPQSLPPANSGRDGGLNSSSTVAFKVGVILDLATPVGMVGWSCMEMAVSDFYAANPGYRTRLALVARDSRRDTVTAASEALDLMKTERVQAIVGPQTSAAADFIADLGGKAHVPIVSFSATSPSISPDTTPYFIRAALNDSYQADAIAALVSAFGWSQVVPIYEESAYGAGAIPYFAAAIKKMGARIPYSCMLPLTATGDLISEELYKLKTKEGRVFLVHMSQSLASRLFAKVEDAGMMSPGFVWIMADGLTSLLEAMDPSTVQDSMQGVVGLRPYVDYRSETLQQFARRWRRQRLRMSSESAEILDLSVFGLWAYDTTWALAMAAEQVGTADPGYARPDSTPESSNDLAALGVSQTGPRLREVILMSNLSGLSGEFSLRNGQLSVQALEIVNVMEHKERRIGFWTPSNGLMRRLNLSMEGAYSASAANLGPVIWPGESTSVPKGWVLPLEGKKLRVLVPGPVEPGFHSFLRVEIDPVTNATVVGGYVIEVFEAAIKALPYAVLVEYVTLQKNGKTAGSYDELVQQVYRQKYDALVGDVTITANRSEYVDFTLPYTASGVSMVVPYKDYSGKNAWIFLNPLTTDLWIVSGAFFVFTGCVVWVLEHRINEEFRGPWWQQFGTVFYFIFSTLVFSHREKIVNNLSRMVVILWVFVVLILQSSYTASLTSMLTVKHLQPTVADVADLKNNGEHVGYLKNSFTKSLLIDKGFHESQMKPYRSPQEYREALNNGSKNGGVSAVIDEIPYLKVFLKDYCSNYTMTGRLMKAGGFGFVFQKGSPMVPDFSRAILDITEGDQMVQIEKRWFGDQASCLNKDSDLTSDSLSMASFWGLFLITGTASFLCLLIFVILFVSKHMHLLRGRDSGDSVWQKLAAVSRHFDQKDLSSHTFRTKEPRDDDAYNGDDATTATPYTHRTATTVTMASPFGGSTVHGGGATAAPSPCTSGFQTPLGVDRHDGGGTPPPELAHAIEEAASPDVEILPAETVVPAL